MNLPSLRSLAAVAATSLLVGGLAACGSNGSDNTDSHGSSSSSSGGGLAGSLGSSGASGSSGSSGSSPSAGQTLDKAAMTQLLKNAMNAVDTAKVHMDMDMAAAGQQMSVTADGEMQTSPLEEKLDMDMGPATMQAVLVDGTMYMKSSQLPSGGKWVKMSLKDMGSMGMGSTGSGLTDPLGMIDEMTPYIDKATYVGDDSTGKHYTMTMDVQGMVKKMGVPSSGGQLPSSASEDFWLDDQGRPVKVALDMGSLAKMNMTMSDFGAPVSIQAPPKSQVTDMSGMSGGSLGG